MMHGAARVRDKSDNTMVGRRESLTYHCIGEPILDAIKATREACGTLGHIATVGLGDGSTS
jgi:hypothetical protein